MALGLSRLFLLMKRITLILIIFLQFCSRNSNPINSLMSKSFYNSWTHSFEENPTNSNEQVYRISDSQKFPGSPFRNVYNFKDDGTCEWLVLHPSDAHYMEPATWKLNPTTNIVTISNLIGIDVVSFEILELSSSIMRIRPIFYKVPECNYIFGKVDVWFNELDFTIIDSFVCNLDIEYTYLSIPRISIRTEVTTGNLDSLKSILEADTKIFSVTKIYQSYPVERNIFNIGFEVAITNEEATLYIESYSELKIIETSRSNTWVRFTVPIGNEDEWVTFFRQQTIVSSSSKAGSFCPDLLNFI